MFSFTRKPILPGGIFVCKLDSKARLVLPVSIRDKLSLSRGDFVSIKVNGPGILELAKAKLPAKALRNSRNSWEVVEIT
ncbi:MAG: AbrB/MazE/SpoVT family DNA-binding domain-containing protein [Candidatus Micrarchaeota archaeon]